MNIVCFHNPDEDNGYLSNWYPSPFTVDGVAFSSMEQFMMYRKAICFGDEAVAAQILSTSDVAKIKSLGRQVSNYDESMWNGIRQIVVCEGLLAKFSQNDELKAKLKATGNAVLAECAVKDCIWGIGLSMKDPDRLNKAKWNGQNLLGYALMMVRERLQQDYSWEQRKLGDNIIEYTETTTKNNQYPPLTSSRKGIFLQTEYFAGNQIASDDNTGYNIVPYGYFTYRHMSDDEIFHFNINDIVENGIVSTLYPVFTTDENLDSRYLQYQLNYGYEFAKFAILQKQGGSRTYMYLNKLKQLYLTMPKSVEEQNAISAFFMSLDHLITLHQRELYKYLRYRILKVRRKS